MDEDRKRDILDEIIELTSPPLRMASDITAQEYALRTGVTDTTAASRLNKLVEQGVLTSHRVYDKTIQHYVRVWRKVESNDDSSAGGM